VLHAYVSNSALSSSHLFMQPTFSCSRKFHSFILSDTAYLGTMSVILTSTLGLSGSLISGFICGTMFNVHINPTPSSNKEERAWILIHASSYREMNKLLRTIILTSMIHLKEHLLAQEWKMGPAMHFANPDWFKQHPQWFRHESYNISSCMIGWSLATSSQRDFKHHPSFESSSSTRNRLSSFRFMRLERWRAHEVGQSRVQASSS
jgi:hypothetical protein